MVDAQTISIVFAGLSIAASIAYYASVLRNANKTQQQALETRQAQLFMQSYRETSTAELQTLAFKIMKWEWTDYADFKEKYVEDPTKFGEWASLMIYLNGLGIMLEEKYIDSELLFKMDQDGTAPLRWWFKFESVIKEMRTVENNPGIFKYFEYYVEEMIRLRKLNGLSTKWSTEQARYLEE